MLQNPIVDDIIYVLVIVFAVREKMKTPLCLEDLSVEQKIGQLLTARQLPEPDELSFAIELAKNHALGAIQVPTTREAMTTLGDRVKDAADYPILVGADMEKGCPMGSLKIAGNLALGAMDDPECAYRFARVTAIEAKEAGYNMIWSPVVDNADHDHPCSIARSFGSNPRKIAELAIPYMRAFAECGVIGSAKHYPSANDSIFDTHMAEGFSYRTKEQLLSYNLVPYIEMMKALGDDMPGIMTGHVKCVNIDPEHPASLSKPCIDIIREAGFDGIIITDSLAMMGVVQKYGDYLPLALAIAAGNDLLLPNYRMPLRAGYEYLLKAYRDGAFSEERLNDAVRHVLNAQARTLRMPDGTVTDEDRAYIEKINRNCICAKCDEGLSPVLNKDRKHLFVILRENPVLDADNGEINEISFSGWWNPDEVAAHLKHDFPASEVRLLCEFPTYIENERVANLAAHADDVVFVTFCEGRCYQGTDGLTERMRMLIASMQTKIAAIVHFGNPYAMQPVVHIPRLIFGFPSELCVNNGLDVLSGKIEPLGHLPIDVKLK